MSFPRSSGHLSSATNGSFTTNLSSPLTPNTTTRSVDKAHVILEQLYNVMQDGLFTDFQIVVQGLAIKVHKVVLASRSSYFKTLFETRMLETEKNELVLSDVELDVFKIFLKYVYTGIIDEKVFKKSASSLILVGAKFQMNELVNKCETSLFGCTTAQNAADHLLIAYLLDRSLLKKVALRVVQNNYDAASKSECWPDIFSHHVLATEVETALMHSFFKSKGDIGSVRLDSASSTVVWSFLEDDLKRGHDVFKQSRTFTISDLGPWKLRIGPPKMSSPSISTSQPGVVPNLTSLYLVYVGSSQPASLLCYFTVLSSTSTISDTVEISNNPTKPIFETQGCWSSGAYYSRIILLSPRAFETLSVVNPNDDDDDDDDLYYASPRGQQRQAKQFLVRIRIEAGSPSVTNVYNECWKNGQYSDAKIVVKNQKFNVHKLVVSTSSRVLEKRFSGRETIDIEDIEPGMMEELLKLMYNSDNVFETANVQVLSAANLYEVDQRITNRLRAAICRRINNENAVEMWNYSLQANDEILKGAALEYILLHFNTISTQQTWAGLKYKPEMHKELVQYIGNNRFKRVN